MLASAGLSQYKQYYCFYCEILPQFYELKRKKLCLIYKWIATIRLFCAEDALGDDYGNEEWSGGVHGGVVEKRNIGYDSLYTESEDQWIYYEE